MFSRQTLMIAALAFIFGAPGLMAVYFFQHPEMLSRQSTNKGDFVRPPVLISSLGENDTSIAPAGEVSKWFLVLWQPQVCEAICLKQLDQLARVRMALGRRYYEVDEVLLIPDNAPHLSADVTQTLHDQYINVQYLNEKEAAALSKAAPSVHFFIANPQGFLVMSYAETAASDDIYHDLKQLLTTTTQTKRK